MMKTRQIHKIFDTLIEIKGKQKTGITRKAKLKGERKTLLRNKYTLTKTINQCETGIYKRKISRNGKTIFYTLTYTDIRTNTKIKHKNLEKYITKLAQKYASNYQTTQKILEKQGENQ